MLTERDLVQSREPTDAPALKIASRDVVAARPDESVFAAVQKMMHEDVRQLPVVSNGRIVGICTRYDVLKVEEERAIREAPQSGWLRLRRPWHPHRDGAQAPDEG